MVYIAYLIGLCFFLEGNKERWFCAVYSIGLIFSKPIRLYLGADGEDFFLYYSYYFVPFLVSCFAFLEGRTRILIILSFVGVILYNGILYSFFGTIRFDNYGIINQGVVLFQTGVLSSKVVGWKKTLGLCLCSLLLTYFLTPYI